MYIIQFKNLQIIKSQNQNPQTTIQNKKEQDQIMKKSIIIKAIFLKSEKSADLAPLIMYLSKKGITILNTLEKSDTLKTTTGFLESNHTTPQFKCFCITLNNKVSREC